MALLVTETSEATLTKILDSSLGGDRRKLDRFFAEDRDWAADVRAVHGLQPGETQTSIPETFCAALGREIKTLKQVHAWLSGGSANDLKAADRLAPLLAAPVTAESFGPLGHFLLTEAGDTTYRRYLPTLGESFPVRDEFPRRVNVFLHEPGFYTLEQVHEQHPALDGRHLAAASVCLLRGHGDSARARSRNVAPFARAQLWRAHVRARFTSHRRHAQHRDLHDSLDGEAARSGDAAGRSHVWRGA